MHAQENICPKRVIIRLIEDSPAAIVDAVNAFAKADVPFTIERVVRSDDSEDMKSALAMTEWKNNELTDAVPELPGVEIIDVSTDDIASCLVRYRTDGWIVKTPTVWKKIIREELRTIGGRTFYVSAEGNDSADGLSPERAWRSLQKVNEANLGWSDTVRFRCGDVFRGQLIPQSGRYNMPIVYSYYGEGAKPIIEPSYDASSETDWVKVGRKLWKCEKKSQNELGNVIFDHGESGCGWKVDKVEQLGRKNLNFCWVRDQMAIYMVSRKNPALRYKSIELAEKLHVIDQTDCHDIVYEGLWLRYGAAHGIGGSGVSRVSILNCDISWIGGSTLYFDDAGRSVRYGNGIEFWGAAQDIRVENCQIWECWDAGLTNQSNIDGVVQKNIYWIGNKIWNCEYSYEYWQQGEGAVTENIVFEKNICTDAGRGWGHKRRWNPNAAHIMFYDTTADIHGFIIRGNTFERSANCGMRMFNAWYDALTMSENIWKTPRRILCRYHARPTSGLIHKYPDYLDRTHCDSEKVIQSQIVEEPLKIRYGKRGLKQFNDKFCK